LLRIDHLIYRGKTGVYRFTTACINPKHAPKPVFSGQSPFAGAIAKSSRNSQLPKFINKLQAYLSFSRASEAMEADTSLFLAVYHVTGQKMLLKLFDDLVSTNKIS
jgi:hypothetical protein